MVKPREARATAEKSSMLAWWYTLKENKRRLAVYRYSMVKGGFPLSRNFYVGMQVNYTRVNKIEAFYGRLRVNVKVEPRSTFTFAHDLHTLSLFYLRA